MARIIALVLALVALTQARTLQKAGKTKLKIYTFLKHFAQTFIDVSNLFHV